MSHNQSRVDRIESSSLQHSRRYVRSGNSSGYHRAVSGGKGGGGGSSTPQPPAVSSSPSSAAASLPNSRSFKKPDNGQGNAQNNLSSQSRGAPSSSLVYHAIQNGAHEQTPLSGNAKSGDVPQPRNAGLPLPKASSSQPTDTTSNSAASSIPPKVESRQFALQFGTISPGIMNGVQVPARTFSAPPNLNEQKRDQALHAPLRPLPAAPMTTAPKQQHEQQTNKVIGVANQVSIGESNLPPQVKRDVHVPSPSGPPLVPPNPIVLPMAGIPMPMPVPGPVPFQPQQLQIPLQFGTPNMQIQPQAVAANSLQMTMGLSAGNAPQVAQPILVPAHLLQQQTMVHQGQGLGFVPPLGHQLNPQVRNLGIGIRSQFPPQQPKQFCGPTPRKAPVKITHPETREELRLEKKNDLKDNSSSGQRSISIASSQSQAVSSYVPSHQMNYYSYARPNFSQSHLPQMPMTSQAPRYDYSVNQVGQPLAFPSSLLPNNGFRPGLTFHGFSDGVHLESSSPVSIPLSGPVQVNVRPHLPLKVEKVDSPLHPAKEVLPKVKPAEGVTASHQCQRPVSSDGPSTSIENHSTIASSVKSSQNAVPGFSSSAPQASSESSGITVAADEYKKKEVKNIEPPQDNQKEPVKKSNRVLDQQPESEALNFTESVKVSSPKIIGVNVTAGIGSPKGVKITGTPAPLHSKELQGSGASVISSNALGLATDGVSGGERCPGLTTPLLHPAETTATKNLDAGLDQNDSCTVDMVTEEKISKVSANKLYQDSADEENPLHHKEISSVTENPVLLKNDVDSLQCTEKTRSYRHDVLSGYFGASNEVSSYTHIEDGREEEQERVTVSAQNLIDAETASACFGGDEPLPMNSSSNFDVTQSEQIALTRSDASAPESAVSHMSPNQEVNVAKSPRGAVSAINLASKEKLSLESPKAKTPSIKKNIKENLSKADAAGTSDLYNAYKGRQKPVEVFSSGIADNSSLANENNVPYDDLRKYASVDNEGGEDKTDFDDWEDAADVPTPNMKKMESGQAVNGMKQQYEDNFEATGQKKYSRDFLLTLSQQFIELPFGFQVGSDIVDALMILPVAKSYITDWESYASSGRVVARSPGTSRNDRRGIGNMDDGKWAKPLGPISPGQGADHGTSKNLRGSGILSGPSRHSPDMDRWQRANHRGSVPSPHTAMQVMHKANNKYEVGKVTDEEQAKQRQLKAILNKLTPQNFEKLFAKVVELHIDNAVTLIGIISQIFDKALMEPTFCEMYADFCYRLAGVLPDFVENNEKITFRRLLLNKCQEEFERGEREQEEANKTEEEGGIKQSEEEREEKRVRARRRMLGNIRLIGELYKKKMLTERIMHDECIRKLLGQYDKPDEEDLEALCKLMSTIGQMIDHQKAKVHMDAYFEVMKKLSTSEKLSPRVRFLLRDVIDLRKNKWQERRKVEGPKKIDEVHRDAAQERQAQSSRLTRGGSTQRRGPAGDYGNSGSNQFTSPISQPVGGFRGSSSQDVRSEDRLHFEKRTLPLPVRQKSTDENAIAFGPQGGLGRGMSLRGQPLISNISPAVKSDWKIPSDQDLNNTQHGWEEPSTKSKAHAYSDTAIDQSSQQHTTVPAAISDNSQTNTFESEDIQLLEKKSLAALREFYSIKDEKEITLCINELNAPDFYPQMISFWIIDAFERKENEINLLANLIVTLSNPRVSLFSRAQLIQGFENVLSSLEDAINDAPKAAQFLGRIFATIVVENIVPLKEIGKLIHEGGEEPGSLRETGLAAEVLGNILECIKLERGDSLLDQIQATSNLVLTDFLPPHRIKSELDKFL